MSTSTPRPTLADAAAVVKTEPRKAEQILQSILDTPAGGQSISLLQPSPPPCSSFQPMRTSDLILIYLQMTRMLFTIKRTRFSSSESSTGTKREFPISTSTLLLPPSFLSTLPRPSLATALLGDDLESRDVCENRGIPSGACTPSEAAELISPPSLHLLRLLPPLVRFPSATPPLWPK